MSDRCEKRPPEVGVAVVLRDLELLLLPHLIVELEDELPEDEGAHIEGENVQEPPVPEHEPVSDVIENVTDSILKHESDSLINSTFARSEICLVFPSHQIFKLNIYTSPKLCLLKCVKLAKHLNMNNTRNATAFSISRIK